MKLFFYLFSFIFLLGGCASADNNKAEEFSKKDVVGIWKGDYDDGPNATIAIYEDSIFNVEHFTSMFYKVEGDSLFQYVDDIPYGFKIIKATNDSLVLRHADGENLYVPFKN